VPLQVKGWVLQRFAGSIVEGPREALSGDGTAFVAHFAIRLQADMKAAFPLGELGKVGVKAEGVTSWAYAGGA